jgi:hypothetical protein
MSQLQIRFLVSRAPDYTFPTPVFGGRLAFNLYVPVGRAQTEIDANVTGARGRSALALRIASVIRLPHLAIQPRSFPSSGIRE